MRMLMRIRTGTALPTWSALRWRWCTQILAQVHRLTDVGAGSHPVLAATINAIGINAIVTRVR
jgi:hypothetical protein